MSVLIYLSEREDNAVLVEAVEQNAQAVIGPQRLAGATEVGVYCVWSEQAHGGKVVVETAPLIGHPGPWHERHAFAWTKPGKADYVSLPGSHLALRVRVVEPIITGSVTVYATGS